MQINDIKTLVARLGAIVDGWNEQSGAPAVERHIAASLLAELYEAVKFDTMLATTEVAKAAEEPTAVVEPSEEEQSDVVSEVIDLSDIFGSSSNDEEVEESVAEEVKAPIEEPTPVVEEITIKQEQPAEEEDIESEIEEEPTPEVEEEPIAEEVQESEEDEPKMPESEPEVESEKAPEVEDTPVIEENESPAIEEVKSKTEEPQTETTQTETEESQTETTQAALFDMEIVRRPRSSSSRRVIMSLYGGSTATSQNEGKSEKSTTSAKEEKPVEPQSAPIEEPTPAQQPTESTEEQPAESVVAAVSVAERIAAAQTDGSQVLGDVIGAGTTTLAEAVAASQPTVQTIQNDRVNSLRNSIGINDRFIMIRDLFGGDGAAFDRAMDELDAFEDFNECLVYMSTYRWNPNSDGARMLMDLVTRKLL